MSELSGGTRLTQKPLPSRLAIQKLGIDDLEGNVATQVRIESFVGDPHCTSTQLPERSIGPPQNLKMFEFFRLRHALNPLRAGIS
jgi:hypothetical protein